MEWLDHLVKLKYNHLHISLICILFLCHIDDALPFILSAYGIADLLESVTAHRENNLSAFRICSAEEEMESVAFTCNLSPREFVSERRGLSRIDIFAVSVKPLSYREKHISLERHHRTVTHRSYVEKVISSSGHNIDERSHLFSHLVGHLSSLLPASVAPGLRKH